MVERHEKQVGAFDLLELAGRALVVEHRIAESPAHLFENRGSPQETKCARTQPGQVLTPEVVRHMPVVPTEGTNLRIPLSLVFFVAQDESGEVQPGGPSFAARDEYRGLREDQLRAGGVQQKLRFPAIQGQ